MVNAVVVLGCLLDSMILKILSSSSSMILSPPELLATLEQAQLCSGQAWALKLGTGDFTKIAQVARWAVSQRNVRMWIMIVAYFKES